MAAKGRVLGTSHNRITNGAINIMAHGDIHKRGEHDPDVELHLRVQGITHTPKDGMRLHVCTLTDPVMEGVMDEGFVDYIHELQEGRVNVFLVPRGLAVEWGLYSE